MASYRGGIVTEEEWFKLGEKHLSEWQDYNEPYSITEQEASAFSYAWELAGVEMGWVK